MLIKKSLDIKKILNPPKSVGGNVGMIKLINAWIISIHNNYRILYIAYPANNFGAHMLIYYYVVKYNFVITESPTFHICNISVVASANIYNDILLLKNKNYIILPRGCVVLSFRLHSIPAITL